MGSLQAGRNLDKCGIIWDGLNAWDFTSCQIHEFPGAVCRGLERFGIMAGMLEFPPKGFWNGWNCSIPVPKLVGPGIFPSTATVRPKSFGSDPGIPDFPALLFGISAWDLSSFHLPSCCPGASLLSQNISGFPGNPFLSQSIPGVPDWSIPFIPEHFWIPRKSH